MTDNEVNFSGCLSVEKVLMWSKRRLLRLWCCFWRVKLVNFVCFLCSLRLVSNIDWSYWSWFLFGLSLWVSFLSNNISFLSPAVSAWGYRLGWPFWFCFPSLCYLCGWLYNWLILVRRAYISWVKGNSSLLSFLSKIWFFLEDILSVGLEKRFTSKKDDKGGFYYGCSMKEFLAILTLC